jgi:2-methylisocitrate lyase-like PEP mutase family enzyme
MNMTDFAARRAEFRKLHESGCFVIPNPWDAGSARYLESMGFKALATTSSGYAFTEALPDHPLVLKRDGVLANAAAIVRATSIPVNCDYQSGYAASADELLESVRQCVGTGVAGLSIEDSTGVASAPLYELSEAVDRMKAARAAIDSLSVDVLLCGRAECFLTGHSDAMKESIRRLQAYADAGADVLFAPGIRTVAEAREIVDAVSPKPVNVLIGWKSEFGVSALADVGVRRISVGSALSRAAWSGFISAAKKLAEGSFDGFAGNVSFAELNGLFGG